ncbi:MAG: hypothetical protein JNM19_09235 [Chitinophagaceae bacterium]|nr:hypothetical protein [Chitinophagaceae bacterium]
MKLSIIKITAIPVLSLGLLMQSCEKKTDIVATEKTDFSNSSIAQVYIATVNASRNAVYVDGKVVSGSLLTSGSVFPGSTPGFNVSPGLKAFLVRDTLSTTTQLPLSFAENMQFAKSYTVFMYDTITAPKQKTVETNIIIPSDTTARLRFANFVYNPTALPSAFDIFSKKRNAVIFSNVNLTDVTPYIPYASGVNDTFYIRPAGTSTNLQNFNPSPAPGALFDMFATLNPVQKRSYTLVFRGGYRAISTSNSTVRTLSVFTNY